MQPNTAPETRRERSIRIALDVLIEAKDPDLSSVAQDLLEPAGIATNYTSEGIEKLFGDDKYTIRFAARKIIEDALLRRGLFADDPIGNARIAALESEYWATLQSINPTVDAIAIGACGAAANIAAAIAMGTSPEDYEVQLAARDRQVPPEVKQP